MNLKALLLSSLILSGCVTTQPDVVYVNKLIPIKPAPEPVKTLPFVVRVVTSENLNEFISENEERNGALVFLAMDLRIYENLSLNIAELRRYILAQKALLEYYEGQINEPIETE